MITLIITDLVGSLQSMKRKGCLFVLQLVQEILKIMLRKLQEEIPKKNKVYHLMVLQNILNNYWKIFSKVFMTKQKHTSNRILPMLIHGKNLKNCLMKKADLLLHTGMELR